jgi:membrane protease subunit (stomatin/prohibitin family)
MQTCPDCQALVNASAVFCDNCGFRLKPATSEPLNQAGGGLVSPPVGSGRINPMIASLVAVNAAPGSCSACGYINTPGEMFCQNCGVQLAPVASVPPPPPTPVSSAGGQPQSSHAGIQPIATNGPVACPTCGYANPSDETFCQNCGVALVAGTQPPTPSGVLHSNLQDSSSISQPPAPRPQPLISTIPGVCPTCNYTNSPGESYCQNCGIELVNQSQSAIAGPEISPFPPSPGSLPQSSTTTPKPPVASAPSICPSCGDVPPPSAVFCPNCGMEFAANQRSPVGVPQSPDTGAQPPNPELQVSTSCPTCGYTNLPGETYCQNCGLLLVAPDTLPQAASPDAMLTGETSPAPPEPEPESPISTLQSPDPNLPPSAPDTKPLTPLSAPPITSSRPPDALIGRLVVGETQASLSLPAGKAGFLIGRPDPARGIFPDIDLSSHGGEIGGVSRQHARLIVNGGQVLIEDLHSLNSTFLNNQRLAPGQRFPLNDGDEIRLGGLVLNFQSS